MAGSQNLSWKSTANRYRWPNVEWAEISVKGIVQKCVIDSEVHREAALAWVAGCARARLLGDWVRPDGRETGFWSWEQIRLRYRRSIW